MINSVQNCQQHYLKMDWCGIQKMGWRRGESRKHIPGIKFIQAFTKIIFYTILVDLRISETQRSH